MKTIKLLWTSAFFMLMAINLFAQTQMNYWALPPYKIDFTGSSPTTSLLPGYNNSAQFYGLTGVAFDNTGNLIVADYQNNAIRKVSPTGIVSTIAGNGTFGNYNGTGTSATFGLPTAVVLDAAQNIFVVDNANHCIRKITPAGVVSTFAGSNTGVSGTTDGIGLAARFNLPYGITIDPSGNLFVADRDNHSIRKITPAGVVSTFAGSNGISGTLNATGTAARFYKPINITIDAAGNFYVTDSGNNRIRKITSAGVVTTIAGSGVAGSSNGIGTAAQFNQPFGIAIDASSNLYVSEHLNNVIRKITPAGQVTTYAGTGVAGFADGPAATAKFQWPTGLTLDASGNLFIAENETHRVRKITPSGIVSTYAGTGVVGFVDTPAPTLYKVSNGAFDENGNVLFYLKDAEIFNASGTNVGTLANYASGGDLIGNEISIVPVPSSCRDFYVIYSKWGASGGQGGAEAVQLMYSKISVSLTGVVSILSNGNFIGGDGGIMCIAVSKLSGNTRYLYALGYTTGIKKYAITSTGIGTAVVIRTNGGKATELELSSNGEYLVWGDFVQNYTGYYEIHRIRLQDNSEVIKQLTNLSCYGIEFSPDNSNIYFSAKSSDPLKSGIYKTPNNIVGGPITPTQITTGHYGMTNLELAKDGNIYAIDENSSPAGLLGKLNPTTDLVTSSGITNIMYSNSSWGAYYAGPPSFYKLPDQIDGENYDYFFGTPKLTNTVTINGSPINATVPLNTYTCGAISLVNTASTATSYQITVTKTDASGNVLTGTQAYSYSPGLITSAPPTTIDIKALNINYLASNTGYYKITFLAQNACASNTLYGLIYNSTMSVASANFQLNVGDGDSYFPNAILPGDTLAASGGSISGSYSTGIIATYKIKVDKVDCITGTILTANIVNTPETAVLNGNPANISAVSFNLKSVPKNYFLSNAGCFMVTYTVSNACGSSSQTGYFNSDPALYRSSNNIEEFTPITNIYPNPTNGIATVAFTMKEDNAVSLVLNNIQGGASYTVFTNQSASQGNNEIIFDTNIIPAGIYVYQLSNGTDTFQTGKFVVVK